MPNISVIAVFKNGSRLFAAPWINGRFQEGPLPLLAKGPYFQLERPGAAWLLIELPVGFRNRRRRHQEIGVIEGTRPQRLQPPLTHPFGVDAGVDDEMGNVDVLRAKLARGRLGDGPQAKLGTGEGRIAGSAAQARGCAGEEDIALAAGQHQAGGFAAGEKAGIAGHFPDLAEHALGGVENREIDVGADVENADLERGVPVGVSEEGDDFLLLARIERARVDFAAGRLDFLHQRFELGAVAAPGEHREPFRSKLLSDFAADVVPGADHGYGRVSLLQGCSPGQVNSVAFELAPRDPFRGQAPRRHSASLCSRILPVEVAGKASSTMISDGRLYEVSCGCIAPLFTAALSLAQLTFFFRTRQSLISAGVLHRLVKNRRWHSFGRPFPRNPFTIITGSGIY